MGIQPEAIKWVHDGRRLPINDVGRSDAPEGPQGLVTDQNHGYTPEE
jgi:hypothetical protein